jgi:hypothetical protein
MPSFCHFAQFLGMGVDDICTNIAASGMDLSEYETDVFLSV